MDHPPARAQIDGILEEAAEAGWKDPAKSGKGRQGK